MTSIHRYWIAWFVLIVGAVIIGNVLTEVAYCIQDALVSTAMKEVC